MSAARSRLRRPVFEESWPPQFFSGTYRSYTMIRCAELGWVQPVAVAMTRIDRESMGFRTDTLSYIAFTRNDTNKPEFIKNI